MGNSIILLRVGDLTWEWTFRDPIKNPLFPLMYAAPYYFIKILNLDSYLFLFDLVPKIMQAFIAALFDIMLIKINTIYNGEKHNLLLMILNYTNWATLTYLSRTYINGS
jgi:hypothetical protein